MRLLRAAHGEAQIDCYMKKGPQCAGSAVYRANVCKMPRDAGVLRLPADRAAVFSSPTAFSEYHQDVGRKK